MAATPTHLKLLTAVLVASALLPLMYRPLRNRLPYATRDVVTGVNSGVILVTLAVNRSLVLTVVTGALLATTSAVYALGASTYPFVKHLVLVPTCVALAAESVNISLGRALKPKSNVRVSYLPMALVTCLVLESVARGVLNTACFPATIANEYFGSDDLAADYQEAKSAIEHAGKTLIRRVVPGPQRGILLDSAVVLQPVTTQRWIFYCGGNMEVMESSLITQSNDGSRLDANVILFNPRGVGKSTGRMALITDLIEDALAVVEFYVRKYDIAEENLMLVGHSIGGGVASNVAVRRFPRSPLVMDRTFSSLSDAAVGFSPVTESATKLAFALVVGDLNTWEAYQKLQHKAKLVLYSPRDEILQFSICSLARLPAFQQPDGCYHHQAIQLPATRPPGRRPHNIPWSHFSDSDALYTQIEQLWHCA